jgi:hypothetical protein
VATRPTIYRKKAQKSLINQCRRGRTWRGRESNLQANFRSSSLHDTHEAMFVCVTPVDMRKQAASLALIVEQTLKRDI